MKRTKPRRGRPVKFGRERTRGPLTIRLRDRVRDDLSQAARGSGRSLSEEVEYRLDLALHQRDYLVEQWGQDVFSIAGAAARCLWHVERTTGRRWIEDDRTFDLFVRTMSGLIANYRDMVLLNRRAVPIEIDGALDGKSDQELAEIFAASGLTPPAPLTDAEFDPEAEYARRAANLQAWRNEIEKRKSRPLMAVKKQFRGATA
jgi:hypothetical protein